MRTFAIAATLIALAVGPALAQTPPAGAPTRIRGTVDKLDGQTLTVKSRDGVALTVALAPNFAVASLVKKSIGDVKAGDYVASTGVKGTDGKIHAVEVPKGQTLKVTYKGTESEYIVDPECPVFGYAQGDASLLKPGAAVFIVAQKAPDGSLSAARVTAEKDGIKPPM